MTITKAEESLNSAKDALMNRILRILDAFNNTLETENQLHSDKLSCEALHGGFSGAPIYRFELKNNQYVVRLFKPEIDEKDNIRQLENAKLAGELGVGPKVLFVDPEMEGYIMDYISGRTVKNEDFGAEENLKKISHLLRTLHGSQQSLPLAKNPIQAFYRFIENGNKQSTPYPTQFTESVRVMQEIDNVLQRYPASSVPCHLDVNSQNTMWNGNDFLLIDWEVGGMSDPFFDLSMFPVFLQLNELQEKMFLEKYFERPPAQLEWDRYVVAQPICLFLRAAVFLSKPGESRNTDYYDTVISKQEVPSFSEIMQLHEYGRLHLPRWKIGLGLMQGGFDLVEKERFKLSIKNLQNGG